MCDGDELERLREENEQKDADLGRAMDDLLRIGARFYRIEDAARKYLDTGELVDEEALRASLEGKDA